MSMGRAVCRGRTTDAQERPCPWTYGMSRAHGCAEATKPMVYAHGWGGQDSCTPRAGFALSDKSLSTCILLDEFISWPESFFSRYSLHLHIHG